MSITAMSSLFKSRYGLSEIQIDLTFIANGVGSMIGTLITGRILDLDYGRVKAEFESRSSDEAEDGFPDATIYREENFPVEKARLRLLPLFSLLQCLSTFITGWTAVSRQSAITTYLVDIFPDRSSSLNLARCLAAAGGTSVVMPVIEVIGVGISFTVCGAVQAGAMMGGLV